MKLRTLLLGAALTLATPVAFAGTPGTEPTPADRAATERTSQESLARTQAAAAQDEAAQDQYAADRAAYADAQDRAAADREVYLRDRAAHRDAMARYRAENVADWAVFDGHDRFVGVTSASTDAVGADVTTPAGTIVGSVDAIDPAGRVAVRTDDDRVIWADAEDFRFDPDEDAVYTDLSRDQLFALAQ
jgi:hypothetical protein